MAAMHFCCSRASNRNNAGAGANGVQSNSKNVKCKSSAKIQRRCQIMQMCIFYVIFVMLISVAMVQSAAVSLNVDLLTNPNFKPLCSAQHEHFIESDGKDSSVILEFKAGGFAGKKKSCTRILSAPPEYGFIVRLILPKLRHHQVAAASAAAANLQSGGSSSSSSTQAPKQSAAVTTSAALNEMSTLIEKLNTTSLKSIRGRTCPLSIFSSLDPHTPQWRVDPCQLEDTAPEMEDPVRLFHGRVRIVWEHGQNTLKSKLMVTALGKGEQCRGVEKHQCLKIGNEPILCISKDLVCDGIRHCPYSNEYDSDEDYSMCWKHRRFGDPMPSAMESDIFEQFALEVFRNLFAYDSPTTSNDPAQSSTDTAAASVNEEDNDNGMASGSTMLAANSTTLRKVHANESSVPNALDEPEDTKTANHTDAAEGGGGFHRRNSTRTGVHSDLSKYGPWGYLMLGMLLCGGALLICGLWASASQHAVNNEREAALAAAANEGGVLDRTNAAAPPNYEELDPPPAYSVLFPNQKAASSNTLNALETAASTGPTQSQSAASSDTTTMPPNVAATMPATVLAMPAMPATTTRVQLEHATSSASATAFTSASGSNAIGQQAAVN